MGIQNHREQLQKVKCLEDANESCILICHKHRKHHLIQKEAPERSNSDEKGKKEPQSGVSDQKVSCDKKG